VIDSKAYIPSVSLKMAHEGLCTSNNEGLELYCLGVAGNYSSKVVLQTFLLLLSSIQNYLRSVPYDS
jgi:hypothetical protein